MEYFERIRLLRTENDQSQKDLAMVLGVHPSTVGMWEQGRREPAIAELGKICQYYNVSLDYLVYGNSNLPNQVVPELNQAIENLTPKQQKKLAEMAVVMFGDK